MKTQINKLRFEELDSTNTYAKENQLPEGSLVIANKQSQGRGRRGHDFFSPEGGIYFSYVKWNLSEKDASFLTVGAAAAVALALEKLGMEPKIKWVNDIYLDGRKVCGILCERSSALQRNEFFYVIGIGINLSVEGFPAELKDKAGAISMPSGKGNSSKINKEALIDSIIEIFEDSMLYSDSSKLADEYRHRSYLTGKTIRFDRNGEQLTGVATGYNDDCNLIVCLKNGENLILTSGEVFTIE